MQCSLFCKCSIVVQMLLTVVAAAAAYLSYQQSQGTPTLVGAGPCPSLEHDGYTVFPAAATPREALAALPVGYAFLNYTYRIHGTALTTWHRDVTSSQYAQRTQHPTYTAIHYQSTGPLLSVAPGSHRGFSVEPTVTLEAEDPGMLVLFNANLLHAGAPPPSLTAAASRRAVQFKIAHQDDIATGRLAHLEGVDVTRSAVAGEAPPPNWLRWLSWEFGWVGDTPVGAWLQQAERAGGLAAKVQRLFPRFYNNPSD